MERLNCARRAFDDADVIHVEDRVDPVQDLDIIHHELRVKVGWGLHSEEGLPLEGQGV